MWPLHSKHSHLAEKEERVQVCFTLHLRDQRSMWMQDGCKVCMASNGSCFIGHLDYFQKPALGGKPNTKPRDHGTPKTHIHWFILFYHVWGPVVSLEIHWNSIWLRSSRILLHTTLEDPWPHYMIWRCLGTAFEHFLLVSHNLSSWLLAHVWSGPNIGCNL